MSAELVDVSDCVLLSDEEAAVWRCVLDGGWALNAAVNAAMAANGLATDDLRLLEALDARSPLTVSELAAAVHMGISKVSRQLQRMVDDGVVYREGSNGDGRHRFVRLTERGCHVLDLHRRTRDQVIRKHVVGNLTDDEFTLLGQIYTKISESVTNS